MQPNIYSVDDHQIPENGVDKDALTVIARLKQAGFDAYLVGGGVRDLLLKKVPKDFDISTSAKPEEIKKIFGRQCLLIGRRFRLAHIRFGHKILEVSTFRSGESKDDLIVKDNEWGTEQEDVLRRDFTINGLFYEPNSHTIIDYVGGWDDIKKHLLRVIGDPEVRFKQDPVRMLRLFKFQARFGFHVEENAKKALLNLKNEIIKSSPPRVLEEIFKMLESNAAEPFFKLLVENKFLHLLFPELALHFESKEGNTLFDYLKIVDYVNASSKKFPIERPVLMAAIFYPLLENEIKTKMKNEGKAPHLGEILVTSGELIHNNLTASFSHFPKRISSMMGYILSTQFKLTPLNNKRAHPIRMFKIREFPMALRLLKIRAHLNKDLEPVYISWREHFRQFLRTHEGEPHRHTAKR